MPKVLLAEDDQTMVGLLTTLLRMDGYEVKAIDADADVPAAVALHGPEILVLDVHLSRQNGLEVLEKIRSADREHRVRVIMISGLNVKEESLRRGADDFLLKPFMPDDLISMLRKNAGVHG
jgi:DNA-binding response OmpR family regulator